MRSHRIALLLVASIFLTGSIVSAKDDNYGLSVSRIEVPRSKSKYLALELSPLWRDDSPTARFVAKEAQGWLIARYKSAYPEIAPSVFDAMRSKDTLLDGRSNLVVLIKDEDLSQIQGMLRIATASVDKPQLPLERDLQWNAHRPSLPEVGPYLYLHLRAQKEPWSAEGIFGNIAEIKSLVTVPNAEREILPLLFALADFATWADADHRASDYYVRHREGRALVRSHPFQIRKDLDLSKVPIETTLPSTYYIQCDAKMVPYYKRLGFELVQSHAIKDSNHVMKMDRATYVEMAARLTRRGGQIMDTLHQYIRGADSGELRALARSIERLGGSAEACSRALGRKGSQENKLDQ